MAYPYGNHQEQQQTTHSAHDHVLATERAILHNPGCEEWTLEEQAVFQEGLIQLASVPFTTRCAAIAKQLPNKNVLKVAQRVKWMNEKERGRKRKNGQILTRKSKDKKKKVSRPAAKSSAFAARPNVSPYAPAMIDNDYGISSKAIGGPTVELLEQNAQALKQISANINAAGKVGNADKLDASEALFKYQDSIKLFCQTRDNIDKILNNFNDMSEVMKKMPPLPVKIDEELFSHLQPSSNKSTDATMMFAYSSRSR